MAKIVDTVAQGPNANPPVVWIDFSKSNLGEIKGVEVGEFVKVVLIGKVQSVTTRQDDQGKMGTLSLEYRSVDVADAPKNDFEALSEDDE